MLRDRNKQRQRRKGIKKKKEKNLANVTGHLSKSKGLQALGSLNMETHKHADVNDLIKLVFRDRNKQRQGRNGIKKKKKKEESLANVTVHLSKSKGLQALGSLNM